MRYTIGSGAAEAVVDTLGGELVSLLCGGERLWQNETGVWSGHAPLLFPVCGNCAMNVAGIEYPIPKHGFARRAQFTLLSHTEDEVVLGLKSDEETRKVYPFEFAAEAGYRLDGSTLRLSFTVANVGDVPLYFSYGGHESFALDGETEEFQLVFEREEPLVSLLHDKEGRLTGERRPVAEKGILPLKSEYFTGGNTLIFGGVKSRAVTLKTREGKPLAETCFDGFENVLVWKPEGARMICIEPWLNLPDRAGERSEFSQKAGVICLASGESRTLKRHIRYLEKS